MTPGAPPSRESSRKPRAPEELTVGYAGSLQYHKGPHLLLEAVRRLGWENTRVRIAGGQDGPPAYRRQLRKAANGLDVEFTGLLDRRAMHAFHRSLDILALTSLWPENLPFVMLEALASGVTVVASDVGGVAHCVPDARLRYRPGDAAGLARALSAALEASPASSPPPRVSTLAEMTDATLAVYERVRGRRGAVALGP